MIYKREDILEVWKGIFKANLPEDKLTRLSSRDIKHTAFAICPKCLQHKKLFLYVNNVWGCIDCNQIKKGKQLFQDSKLASILTNDLFEYFGELSSEHLFNSELIDSFIKFNKIDENPRVYVLLLQFVKAILAKEVGALKIIGYISAAENRIRKFKENRENIGTKPTIPDKSNGPGKPDSGDCKPPDPSAEMAS